MLLTVDLEAELEVVRRDVGRLSARNSERELRVLGDLFAVEEGHTGRGIAISLRGLGRHHLVILNEGQHDATYCQSYGHLGAEVDRLSCLDTPRASHVLSAFLRYFDLVRIRDEVVVDDGFALQVLDHIPKLINLVERLILDRAFLQNKLRLLRFGFGQRFALSSHVSTT